MSSFPTATAARLITLGLLLATGCGGGAEPGLPDGASANDAASVDARVNDPTAALGAFVVSLVPATLDRTGKPTAAAYTSVFGKVYDGPLPETTVWTVVADSNGCRLSTPQVPFCNPTCGGAACVEGGHCVAYPSAQNLGRVHVAGVGGAGFDMDPIAGNYQPDTGVALPFPPFQEGDVVRMTAPGGALGPVTLESRGIVPLIFTETPSPTTGQPLKLTWTPAAQPDLARIEIKLDISHHGGAKGKIECQVADTGSFEIPAAQISQLIALGVAGYPTIVLARVATGTTSVAAGIIALRVFSSVERAVQIEGLRSCTADNQCPAGMTCRTDLTCK